MNMKFQFTAEPGQQAKINRVEITPVTFPNAAAPSERNRIFWQVRIEHTYGTTTRNEESFAAACQLLANYDAPFIPTVESVRGERGEWGACE